MPKVSICIPTYNHADFLGHALESAMEQTFLDTEIVVLDNDSGDHTASVVAERSLRDPRIRYVRHSENRGLTGNLNACIEYARGEYVKILCADDLLERDCVAAMVKVLDEFKSVTLVGCARKVTDENLSVLRIARINSNMVPMPGDKMVSDCFFFGNRIGEPTAVMFRRSECARGFDAHYEQLVDMEMWIHLLRFGDFYELPMPLCTIRSHSGQATWVNDRRGQIVADRKRLFVQFGPAIKGRAGYFLRFLWDFRMAYAINRSVAAGNPSLRINTSEVFFPRLYRGITFPLVKVLWRFGLPRVWKTSYGT